MNRLGHLTLAAIPLCLTPFLFFAIAEGWLNFGGGEKDLLLLIPYLIWSLSFFIIALVLILKKKRLSQWCLKSFIFSIFLLAALGFVTYLSSWLGIV